MGRAIPQAPTTTTLRPRSHIPMQPRPDIHTRARAEAHAPKEGGGVGMTEGVMVGNTMVAYDTEDEHMTQRSSWLSNYPYTGHTTLTFIIVHFVMLICYVFARIHVLPTRAWLIPLSVILPVLVSFALHRTLSTSTRRDCASLIARHARAARVSICDKCALPRTRRAHHCRHCARCTPRMSHHCGVLGVCIGHDNQKHFLLFLCYTLIAMSISTWCTIPGVSRLVAQLTRRQRVLDVGTLLYLQAAYLHVTLSVTLALLLAFHMRLAIRNWTVLEAVSNKCLWRVSLPVSPYDRGSALRNLRDVFGSGWAALLPIAIDDDILLANENRDVAIADV